MRWGACVAVLAVFAAGVTSCSAPAPAALPDGVTVAVIQPRTEEATGRLAFEVVNGSHDDITLTRAEFDSPDYSEPIVWKRHDARLAAGYAIDLRVDPVDPSCAADADSDAATVVLDYRLADGSAGRATLEPTDPFSQFPKIPDRVCVARQLDDVAPVAAAHVVSDGLPGHPGRLVLSITPADNPGDVSPATLHAIRSTILITLLDAGGLHTPELPVEQDLLALDGPTELDFPIAPARCDTHAIAEDKVGTLIPIVVTVGARSDTIRLPSTPEFKGEVYAFVQSFCG